MQIYTFILEYEKYFMINKIITQNICTYFDVSLLKESIPIKWN